MHSHFSRIRRFATLCASLATVVAASAQTYTLTNLGTFGGSASLSNSTPYSIATAINNSGQIVGISYNPAHQQKAFLYQDGVMTNLTTIYGNAMNNAKDISDSGQIVGGSSSISGTGTLSSTPNFYPIAVNSTGLIVGSNDSYPNQAASYFNGTVTVLPAFNTGGFSVANNVNTSGQIVGYSANSSGKARPFVYANGVLTDLGTFATGGGLEGIAYDINDSGTIVGYSKNAANFSRAFVYSGGVMTNLGTLNNGSQSVANAINESGQIVGYSINGANGQQDAFIYQNGVMTNLNTFIDPTAAGFQYLTQALDINDLGQIVGYGRPIGGDSSTMQAFLLTPVVSAIPEPSTYAAFAGLGAFAFLIIKRRKFGLFRAL